MQARQIFAATASLLFLSTSAANAKVNVAVVHNSAAAATGQFKLRVVPSPSDADAAAKAKVSIVAGRRDQNGGDVDKLIDGAAPRDADQPAENFFFGAGTAGGRLVMDLGSLMAIDQLNTYSWHTNTRAPQVYKLFGSDGKGERFNGEPGEGVDPEQAGWTLIAEVDTRPAGDRAEQGGQYGVSIFDSEGAIGPYRYLLFDVSRTENDDAFGNTFLSEIDVVASQSPAAEEPGGERIHRITMETDDATYTATIDTTDSPELTKWANEVLAPVVKDWYPKIVKMLPSEGFEAPRKFSIRFSPEYRGVAATGGTRVTCATQWFNRNLEGEAKGAVVHELVHVVQQYGRARRRNPDATRSPGWLVEGVADYVRWFLYEPESRGAEITERNFARARHDGSYRITANFLYWVSEQHGRDIVPKLNAAMREGRYNEDLWSDYTKKTLAELNNEWRASLARAIGVEVEEEAATESTSSASAGVNSSNDTLNTLSQDEKQAGWQLLFDGKSLNGWHTFRMDGVRPGWQLKEGAVVCANPSNAGDLCTNNEYDWFELKLEYNISKGGNSGIMYHVTEEGRTAWATGPEVQLEDNPNARDPVKTGWLYALYQPPDDPKTGTPLDATRPAGEWNQLTLLISPEKCVHEINGTKYFEYSLDSEDFQNRVADSKFARMRRFAKTHKGSIALQGDHGEVSFRNIKIRPIVSTIGAVSGER